MILALSSLYQDGYKMMIFLKKNSITPSKASSLEYFNISKAVFFTFLKFSQCEFIDSHFFQQSYTLF